MAGDDNAVTKTPDAPVAPANPGAQAEADMPIGTPAQVFGKVTSIHNVSMVGMSEQHALVKLESAPGDIEIVDLGSVADLKTNGIEVKEGQQFWVDGRVGKINGKPLVVAERISESKLVVLNRQAPLREETTKHADARQAQQAQDVSAGTAPANGETRDPRAPRTETVDAGEKLLTIQGNVIHTRHISIEGESFQHVLAKVQTENGIVVLDLGTCSTLPASVDLSEGKAIAASGVIGHLNGKPVLLAESVGNQTSIQRPNEPTVTPATPTSAGESADKALLRK